MEIFAQNTVSEATITNNQTKEESNMDEILKNAAMVAGNQNINATLQQATAAAVNAAPARKTRGKRPTNEEIARKFLQFKGLKDAKEVRSNIIEKMGITEPQYRFLLDKYETIRENGDMIRDLAVNTTKGILIPINKLSALSNQPFGSLSNGQCKAFAVPFGDGIIVMPDTQENRDKVMEMRKSM